MSQEYHGYFEYNDERYDFDAGIAQWSAPYLTVYGEGADLLLVFNGIPFRNADQLADINGASYDGQGGTTPFSESLIRFFDTNYFLEEGTIRCLAANAEKSLVSIEFELNIKNTDTGTFHDVRGGVKCVIGEIPEWSYD